MKSGGRPCPRTKSAAPASRLESASERHSCGHLARPGVPQGACFARLWIPAHLSEPWQVWSGTRWRVLLGHTSPSRACCGGGAGLRDGGLLFTRGSPAPQLPPGPARTARKLLSQRRRPGPQVLALEMREEGPEVGGSCLAEEAGGPKVPSVPGEGRGAGWPGRPAPRRDGTWGEPSSVPGGPACVSSQGT